MSSHDRTAMAQIQLYHANIVLRYLLRLCRLASGGSLCVEDTVLDSGHLLRVGEELQTRQLN